MSFALLSRVKKGQFMPGLKKRGRVWWARLSVGDLRIEESLDTTSIKEARRRLKDLQKRYRAGPAPGRGDLAQRKALDSYCEYLKTVRTGKSAASDVSRLRRFFREVPVRTLSELTPGHIQTFGTRMIRTRGLAHKTINDYRAALRAFYNYAVNCLGYRPPDGVWPNPATRVKRLREPAPQIRYLTMEQIEEQLAALEDIACNQEMAARHFVSEHGARPKNRQRLRRLRNAPSNTRTIRAATATCIFGGLRRGEALWLTRDDVLLEAGRARIHVRAKTVAGQFWQPKTKTNRTVPVSGRLRAVLAEYVTGLNGDGPWFFPSPEGTRWLEDNFSADLRVLQKRAGLKWGMLDFRHSFGTHLARKGVSLYKVSKLMGNSPDICRKHYANVMPEELADEVEFDGQ